MATQGMCDTFKAEVVQGAHCFNATQSGVSCTCSSTTSMTALASTAGLTVGMAVTGTNAAASTYIAAVTGATTLTLSVASTGALTSATFTADIFKILLIKASPSRTFDHTQTNVGTPGSGSPTTSNVGTDETTNTSGTGYTSGGFTLVNVTPSVATTTGIVTFNTNPSWTSSTFTTTAAIIYNSTSTRIGAAATPLAGRTVGVYDFSGAPAVVSGTFTLVLPAADASNACIRFA